ncbi:alpha/beta hydrolase [Oryzobacter telluris]|uniref:alpha/beta hydrolase n=1 Tax=Oryzobacter telluris TaxID=3149179 RepID=UPI00370D0FC9
MPNPFVLTRLMMFAAHHAPDRTPADVGLAYEEAEFPSADGVVLRGWFVTPNRVAGEPVPAGPAVVVVHGWLWNRLGNVAGLAPFEDRAVDFLPATKALVAAGISVLLFDLPNHGLSDDRRPVTFGLRESADVVAAVEHVRTRTGVDPARVGILGCSMGGNAAIYAVPRCQPVRAVLAVQPAVVAHFNANFARDVLGPLGPFMSRSMDLVYWVLRAPRPSSENPAVPAKQLGDTVVRYVQGTGDQWGSMDDVRSMVAATPHALPLVEYPSTDRYAGYRYVTEQPDGVAEFFDGHL